MHDVIAILRTEPELHSNAMFMLCLANGAEILAHVSGKIRMHTIRIYSGACEPVALSP